MMHKSFSVLCICIILDTDGANLTGAALSPGAVAGHLIAAEHEADDAVAGPHIERRIDPARQSGVQNALGCER